MSYFRRLSYVIVSVLLSWSGGAAEQAPTSFQQSQQTMAHDSLWAWAIHLPDKNNIGLNISSTPSLAYGLKKEVTGAQLHFSPYPQIASYSEDKIYRFFTKQNFFDASFTLADFHRLKHVLTANEMIIYRTLTNFNPIYLAALKFIRRNPQAITNYDGVPTFELLQTLTKDDIVIPWKNSEEFNYVINDKKLKNLQEILPDFLDKSRRFKAGTPFLLNPADPEQKMWIDLIKHQLSIADRFYFDIIADEQDHFIDLPASSAELPYSFIRNLEDNPHWIATMFYRAKKESWSTTMLNDLETQDIHKGLGRFFVNWHLRSKAYALLKYRYLRLQALYDITALNTLEQEYPFWRDRELDANFPLLHRDLNSFGAINKYASYKTGFNQTLPPFLSTLKSTWESPSTYQYVIKSFGPSFPIILTHININVYFYQQVNMFDPAFTNEMYEFFLRYAAQHEPAKLYSYTSRLPHNYDVAYGNLYQIFGDLEKRVLDHPFSPGQEELTADQAEIIKVIENQLNAMKTSPPPPLKKRILLSGEELKNMLHELLASIVQEAEAPDAIYTIYHYYPAVGKFYYDYKYWQRLRAMRRQQSTISYTDQDIVIPGRTASGVPNQITFTDYYHFETGDGWKVTLPHEISVKVLAQILRDLSQQQIKNFNVHELALVSPELDLETTDVYPWLKEGCIQFPVTMPFNQDLTFSFHEALTIPAKNLRGQANQVVFVDSTHLIDAQGHQYALARPVPQQWFQRKTQSPGKAILFPLGITLDRTLNLLLQDEQYDLTSQVASITFPWPLAYPNDLLDPQLYPALSDWAKIDLRHLTVQQRYELENLLASDDTTAKQLFANFVEDVMAAIFPKGFKSYIYFVDPQLSTFLDKLKTSDDDPETTTKFFVDILQKQKLFSSKIITDELKAEKIRLAEEQALAAKAAQEAQRLADERQQQARKAQEQALQQEIFEAKSPAEKLTIYLELNPALWPTFLAQIGGTDRIKDPKISREVDLLGEVSVSGDPQEKTLLNLRPMQQILQATIQSLAPQDLVESKLANAVFKFLCLQRFVLEQDNATFETYLQNLEFDKDKVISIFYENFVLSISEQEFAEHQVKSWSDPRFQEYLGTLATIRLIMTASKPFKMTEFNKAFFTETDLQNTLGRYFQKQFWGDLANEQAWQLLQEGLGQKETLAEDPYELRYPGLERNWKAKDLLAKLQKSTVFQQVINTLIDAKTNKDFNPFTEKDFELSFTGEAVHDRSAQDPALTDFIIRHLYTTIHDPAQGLDQTKVVFFVHLPNPNPNVKVQLKENIERPIVTIVQIDQYQGLASNDRILYIEERMLNAIYSPKGNLQEIQEPFVQWMWDYLSFGEVYLKDKFGEKILRGDNSKDRYNLTGAGRVFAELGTIEETQMQILFPYKLGKHNTSSYDSLRNIKKIKVPRLANCARNLTTSETAEEAPAINFDVLKFSQQEGLQISKF